MGVFTLQELANVRNQSLSNHTSLVAIALQAPLGKGQRPFSFAEVLKSKQESRERSRGCMKSGPEK